MRWRGNAGKGRRAGGALLALSLVVAAAPIHAEPDYAAAAALVSGRHLSRPPIDDVPRDSVAGLQAYLSRLDPYSRYLTSDEYHDARDDPGGTNGLGGLVTTAAEGLLLVPLQKGPAFMAGLRHPLLIESVDGQPLEDGVQGLRRRLFGRQALRLAGRDLVDNVRLEREVRLGPFRVAPVEHLSVDGHPLIRLNLFLKGRTVPALRSALEAAPRGRPVVVDLRYAAGGDLHEAIDAASLILPRRLPIASTRDGDGHEVVFVGGGEHGLAAGRLILLIGPQTASAAEVFARALLDHGQAIAVGRASHGKCLLQQLLPLPGGDALDLTVARIHDPAGRACDGRGIDPTLPFFGNIHDTERLLAAAVEPGARPLVRHGAPNERGSP